MAAFFFTEHQNSYAARTGRPDNVGVIGVAVFRRKVEPEARIPRARLPLERRDGPAEPWSGADASADDAPRAAESDAARQAPSLAGEIHVARAPATAAAKPRASPTRSSSAPRAHPEEVIAIHYDTYANLVAMGVIRGPRIATPSPFPGQFVPDPR